MEKYDIEKTYTSFWWGIADDEFIWWSTQVLDISWIDVRTNSRFLVANSKFQTSSQVSIGAVWGATGIKYTPYWVFTWDTDDVYLWLGNVTWVTWFWFSAIEYGWVDDTVTNQINYLFGQTVVKKCNYNCSSVLASPATAIWDTVTATAWHLTNILFSQKNKIYYYDSNSDTITLWTTLEPWLRVKKIYSYSTSSIIVIWVKWNDTIIYEIEFTGWAYNILRKLPITGYKCIDAVWDGYSMYWTSREWIHQYQWGWSQLVRKVTFNSSDIAKLAYNKWLLLIADWQNYYRYWATKPWYTPILDKIVSDYSISAVDKDYVATFNGTSRYYDQLTAGWYYLTNTIDLLPIDWGIYEIPKHDLTIRYGYINPLFSSYTNTTDRCEIQIQVKTDEIERNWTGWLTIHTNAEDTYGYKEISPQEIITAMESNWLKSEWGYLKIRIVEKSGDKPWTAYLKTSKVFDITIKANYVKR